MKRIQTIKYQVNFERWTENVTRKFENIFGNSKNKIKGTVMKDFPVDNPILIFAQMQMKYEIVQNRCFLAITCSMYMSNDEF